MSEARRQIEQLLEDLTSGDSEKALESLSKVYYGRLMRYLYLWVKEEEAARELLSDVFLAVWDNRHNGLYAAYFNTYIYRIAKYKAINYLKKQKVETVVIDNLPVDLFKGFCTVTPEDIYISKEKVREINEAIEKLPAKCKMAFKLVREDRLSYGEAAEIMDISVGTLNAHLYKAVKTIKEKLSE
ncbi:MAG: sigma-70 family RNA polymerase sigma factor [Alistipes sp.]|nr:sigma-70 family RNA polymerase sigma factor [Alistipes sp.]